MAKTALAPSSFPANTPDEIPAEACPDGGGSSTSRLCEYLIVHVLVVVATRRFLDDRAEQQITGIAEAERLSGHRARSDRRVHSTDEIGDRLEVIAHAEVAGIVLVVPGSCGLAEEHRDRDLVAWRVRICR